MDLAVGLPTMAPTTDAGFLLEWARLADAGPFSSLMCRDRVVYPAKEPLIALSVAAGATRRIGLLASTILTSTRETTLVARQAASLDVLSGGRFTLGVGVGYREDDYVATGYAFHERGRRLDAQLETLHRIWAGELIEPDGAPPGVTVGPIGPAPATPGGPRVMVGGHVPPVARRVARWGQGYLATVGGDEADQAKMLGLWALVQEAWEAAGRAGRPRLVTGAYFALGPTADADADDYILTNYRFRPDVAARMRRGVPTSPQALRDVIRRQEDLGADEFILMACVEELRTIEALLDVVGSR